MRAVKLYLSLVAALFLAAVPAYAGVFSTLKAAASATASSGSLWMGIGAVALAFIFKRMPNQKIYGFVSSFAHQLGVALTLGLGKFKWTAPFWGKIIEPWFIDFIENTVGAAVNGFIAGLRSDNGATTETTEAANG